MDKKSSILENKALSTEKEDKPSGGRKPYSTPIFSWFGDVKTLTLAPSPGTFESGGGGSGFNNRPPTGV